MAHREITRDEHGLWRPGASANPAGRPKGSRNRLGEDFIAALQEDFQTHGKAAIEQVRRDRPHEYLKIVASILPKEFKFDRGPIDDLSDDELFALLVELRRVVAEKSGTVTVCSDAQR